MRDSGIHTGRQAQGVARSLILFGHSASESTGMKRLADRLAQSFSTVPVRCIPDEPLIQAL
ncbi:hypothetical protein [Alicyclobacillus herbarius]|uniref:hypothetical protein n=1 Tax=Alicyclobacillus herbarius TaxID=122960 RepID=UPI0004201048|nr:hypothetical protein [Alicyclobacillus herbarius]